MATPLANLLARQQAITDELAAMTSSRNGGKPTYTIDGQTVDHIGYRKSLYEELAFINQQISVLQGPFEEIGQAVT